MSAGGRQSHLSIGEVLSLVQQEFPDVTISKIRFLESQGLIAPERTASGFRKFYDDDIQRLRWILRQQSDHFLPLKVIKKMLDEGVDPTRSGRPAEAQPTLWSSPGEPTEGPTETNGVAVERSSRPASSEPHDDKGATGDSAASTSPVEAQESTSADTRAVADSTVSEEPTAEKKSKRRSSSHPSVVAAAMTKAAAAAAEQRAVSAGTTDQGHGGQGGPGAPGSSSTPAPGQESAEPRGKDATRSIMTPADIVAALQEDPRPRSEQRRSQSGQRGRSGPETGEQRTRSFTVEEITGPGSDAEFLSAEEVCELFDIEPGLLDELEKFGLLAPRRFGGVGSYDEFDVAVIGMAVKYESLGVGARHLRMYKIAAEREAGFIEQLVVPLLKQRNPTARENASERCSELASMGNELHNLILKRHLRSLFGNR